MRELDATVLGGSIVATCCESSKRILSFQDNIC